MSEPKDTSRRNALSQVAAGGALVGAGSAGDHVLNERLKRAGAQGVMRSAVKGKFKPRLHGAHLAGKAGVRALQLTGLPLAAVGVKNTATGQKTRKVSIGDDVIRPASRRAVFLDQVEAGEKTLAKGYVNPGGLIGRATAKSRAKELARIRVIAGQNKELWSQPARRAVPPNGPAKPMSKALLAADKKKLQRRRKTGRTLSLVGGTLGLTALGLRAPEAAKFAAGRGLKAKNLASVARFEPAATKASNTTGIAAIGTGSAGSFNYASQQKLERKRDMPVVKGLPRGGWVAGKGRVRVVGSPKKDFFDVVTDRDERLFVGRDRIVFTKPKTPKPKEPKPPKPPVQPELPFGKAVAAEDKKDALLIAQGAGTGIAGANLGKITAGVRQGMLDSRGHVQRVSDYRIDRLKRRQPIPGAPKGAPGERVVLNSPDRKAKIKRIQGQQDRYNQIANRVARGRVFEKPSRSSRAAFKAEWRAAHPKPVPGTYEAAMRAGPKTAARFNPGFKTKVGTAAGLMVGGGAMTLAGARGIAGRYDPSVNKGVNEQHKVDAAAAGFASGAGSYQLGLYATKPYDRKLERRIQQDADAAKPGAVTAQSKLREHAKQVGMPRSKPPVGDKRWLKYFRTYPKDVPGARFKRTMSYAHGGKTGVAATVGAGLIGAGIGVKAADDVRKDMFLRRNRQRISPDAERGYKTLSQMRSTDLTQAAGSASLAGVGGWLTHHEWKAKPRVKPALAAAALGTAGATLSTVGQLRSAHRIEGKREKIRAKARSRKAQGLYAPGRGLEPVDTTSRRARRAA